MRLGRTFNRVLTFLAVTVFLVVYLFPLYWLLVTSFKSTGELYAAEPTLTSQRVDLEAYRSILVDKNYIALLRNSIVVCTVTVIVTLSLALLITYPLTRLPVSKKLRVGVMNWALSLRFMPPIAVIIPYFTIITSLGLFNRPGALVLLYTLFNLPLAIWMLKGFMEAVPREIEEASYVDGASRLRTFFIVILPLVMPGILPTAVMTFIFSWSEFLFALILTATPAAQTFPVGVSALVTQFLIIWNEMAAAGVVALIVPLLLLVLARRYILTGLTFGVVHEK
jgi:multiple sugar transport system permease protein